jgi:hypothetical protein
MAYTISRNRKTRWNAPLALTMGSCLLVALAACGEGEREPGEMPSSEPMTEMEEAAQPGVGQGAIERAATAVPAGTSMTFTVDETVSTDDNEVGDQFTATLQSPVTGPDGRTLIEAGTPSRWTVQEASTEGDSTVLAAQLESMQVDGSWETIPARVVSADVQTDTADTGGETAAKIGVGAAAGALIGQILGDDTRSTLAGAGVGAAAGTIFALATRGGSAELPAGSSITVELTAPLRVSQ